jgi:hypothetical protein
MKWLVVLSVVLLLVLSLSAQTTKLTVKEFDAQIDAAIAATAKKVRRVSETFTAFEPGKEVKSWISTYEYIPPDRFRSYMISGTDQGLEYIEASEYCYIKRRDGVWNHFYVAPDIPPYFFWDVRKEGAGSMVKTSDLRKDVVDGEIVQKYSRESRQIFDNGKGRPPSPPVAVLDEVWIGSNGLVVRAESLVYDGNNGKLLQKSILIWQYDPKDIKIEAPTIKDGQ